MPNYFPLSIKGHQWGQNTRVREDMLAPGEAVVAKNVLFRNHSIEKRRGFRNVLTGDQSTVLKGGPPGASIYVQGDQYWLEHPLLEKDRPGPKNGGATASRYGYHRREGLLVIPEGSHDILRLDVKAGDDEWMLEFCLWTDDPTTRHIDADIDDPHLPAIVMAKGDDTESNWAVRLIPQNDPAAGTTRVYCVLTLYEAGAHASGTDFFYTDGGTGRGWFDPGKNHWFAFRFDQSPTEIVSYYWQEGMGAPVTSSQSAWAAGSLRTNGTQPGGSPVWPITIGKRAKLIEAGGGTDEFTEAGFNGVLSELRVYDAGKSGGGALVLPTGFATTSWYLEEEIAEREVDGTAGGASVVSDLILAYSMRESSISGTRFCQPRYNSAGALVRINDAWVHGADATWQAASGVGGSYGLEICPAGNAAANNDERDAYYRSVGGFEEHFGAGIRIPRSNEYLKLDTSSSSTARIWPDVLTIRWTGTIDSLPASGGDAHTLFDWCRVEEGTGSPTLYRVLDSILLQVQYTDIGAGNQWNIRWFVKLNAAATVDITTPVAYTVPESTQLTIIVMVGIRTGVVSKIYVDGVEQATSNPAGTEGPVSEPTNTTDPVSDPNRLNFDHEDDRDQCFPMAIGCRFNRGESTAPYRFQFGAPAKVGSASTLGRVPQRGWAFHTNEAPKLPDSGVGYRGGELLRGKVTGLQIWLRFLTESEVNTYSSRPPNRQEIAAYGPELLSSWDFEEGKGNLIFDQGYLGNHLPLNPRPQARLTAGPIHRATKSDIVGFWEVRNRTFREGIGGRHLYMLAGGSILETAKDGSDDLYATPLSSRHHHIDKPLPSAFQFADFFYICVGEGPVLRVSQGKIVDAGVSPVFGQPQGDHLGWVEEDRDGTFQIINGTQVGVEDAFELNRKYGWAVTFYDPESGVESAPSRLMVQTVDDYNPATGGAGSGQGWFSDMQLALLPRSRQRHVTQMRIYRTTKNTDLYRFVDQIDSTHRYFDTKPDAELGGPIESVFNLPPPNNIRLGVIFNSRAIYAGVPEAPATIFYSRNGFPEAVPAEYRITIAAGRSAEITGLLPLADRVLCFLQDTTYVLFDTGRDITVGSLEQPPLQISVLKENIGCVNHQTIVSVDGIGAVFAGERGVYVTDGVQFRYVSDRIEKDYEGLDRSTYRSWHAIHNRRDDQYLLFCSSGDTPGRNDRVIVWDYARNAFCIYEGIEARYSQVIEDADTGQNRFYFSDYFGQLWEFDPADLDVYTDGVPAGPAVSGTTLAGSTTTVVVLVNDNSLPTDADGLRGVTLTLGDPNLDSPASQSRHIIANDANTVTMDAPLVPAIPVPTGTPYRLGRIAAEWKSGKMNFGSETRLKRVNHVEVNFEPSSGSSLDAFLHYDELPADEFRQSLGTEMNPAGERDRLAPIHGSGRRFQVRLKDEDPDNPWEVTEMEIGFHVRGRSKY